MTDDQLDQLTKHFSISDIAAVITVIERMLKGDTCGAEDALVQLNNRLARRALHLDAEHAQRVRAVAALLQGVGEQAVWHLAGIAWTEDELRETLADVVQQAPDGSRLQQLARAAIADAEADSKPLESKISVAFEKVMHEREMQGVFLYSEELRELEKELPRWRMLRRWLRRLQAEDAYSYFLWNSRRGDARP